MSEYPFHEQIGIFRNVVPAGYSQALLDGLASEFSQLLAAYEKLWGAVNEDYTCYAIFDDGRPRIRDWRPQVYWHKRAAYENCPQEFQVQKVALVPIPEDLNETTR